MICPSCGTDNAPELGLCRACEGPLRPVVPGTVLSGRYEILEVLGRGGMGSVYAARDRAIEDTVAVKVLRPEIAGSPELARRFLSEVRLARRVSHPNVCRIYEYGEDGGLRFLAMELVDGHDLKRLLADGPLPPARALAVAVAAADALEAIHAAGIVHRDLKTANVMLDRAGTVKLMDFGIAKQVGGGTPGAPSGYVVGSPEYMSPEQGRGRAVDARSDIYALGVVVFELFTGRVPFHAETPIATLMQHVEAPPPLGDPALPPAVAAVLARALAKDPADRFPAARDLAAALRQADTDAAGHTRELPAVGRTGRARFVLAVALAVVLAGAWAFWPARDPTAGPTPGPAATATPSRPVEASAPHAPTSAAPASASPSPAPAALPPPAASAAPTAARPSPTAASGAAREQGPRPTPLPTERPATAPPPTIPAAVAADSPAATPPPAAPPSTTLAATTGTVLVVARPWGYVAIDGVLRGETPLPGMELPPGTYQVVVTHPEFLPYRRQVTVTAGGTVRVSVDFPGGDGVRRRR